MQKEEHLQIIHGNNHWSRIDDQIKNAIIEDSIGLFNIAGVLNKTKLHVKHLHLMFQFGAENILKQIIDEDSKTLDKICDIGDVLRTAIFRLDEKEIEVVLNAVEKQWPNAIAATVDKMGNNLLFYVFGNLKARSKKARAAVIQLLLDYGCSPYQRNDYFLNFNDLQK